MKDMSIASKELERLRYWQGQMLRSRDFRDQVAIESQLRWWHNRALHNTYGVSFGLKVIPDNSKNPPIVVRVTCGLAYDCFGRELILLKDHPDVSVPQQSSDEYLVLLIRYKETSQYLKKNEIGEACLPNSCSLFQEELEFQWRPLKSFRPTDGVPLAQAEYDKNSRGLLSLKSIPMFSRPLARPRIASGATIPGNTAWEKWTESNNVTVGMETRIDTSSAGFTETPNYFAWLQSEEPLWDSDQQSFILAPFTNISDPAVDGFKLRLLLPNLPKGSSVPINEGFDEQRFITLTRKRKLYVCWLGCQMANPVEMICAEPSCCCGGK